MAYVAGLYTRASEASANEATRFRQFQTDIDAMAERERQAKMRQQQAGMDQFTAGLTPRSDVAVPNWTVPAAPPAPKMSGGSAGVSAPGSSSYERQRLAQERRLIEQQYASETATLKTEIDNLGKQKYTLQQQLTVAPPSQAQMIRDKIIEVDMLINRTIASANNRVDGYRTLFSKIDDAIRGTDKGQAMMAGKTPAAPDAYTPGLVNPAAPAAPAGLGANPQPIPVPDSLLTPPEAAPPTQQPGTTSGATPPAVVDPAGQAFLASLTPAQFNALPKAQQDAILAKVNRERQANADRANLFTVPAAAADLAAGPFNALITAFNWASEGADFARYARAIGLGDIETIQAPYLGADPSGGVTATPYTDMIRRLREASTPLTREQFLENLKANEQQASVQAGKGDAPTPPAAGLAPPGTLQQSADVAVSDPTVAQYSAQAVAARAPALFAKLNEAVASEQGQAIISRARALGVDPAAAMAIYGIESSFGASAGVSGAGAKGPLQVMPAQATLLKTWFNDPRNIRQYNISPELVNAAKSMTADSIDAGLLQLKYNELIGLPKNLWGAGYQGNADAVRKAGAPLPVHDAGNGTQGLTNSDYNKLYVELYNSAAQVVNIPPSTSTPTEGIVGNSQAMRTFDTIEQQLVSDFQFSTQTINQQRQQALAKRQEAVRRMEVARQFSDLGTYERERDAILVIDEQLRASDVELRTAETQARIKMEEVNLARLDEYVKMATRELDNRRNPQPLADMVTRGTGSLVEIEVIGTEPPLFAVYENNMLVSGKGYTAEQLKDKYLSPISAAYAAQRAAIAEEDRKFKSERLKAELKLLDDITLEEFKASNEAQKQGWTEGKEVTDPNTNRITEKWYTKGNRIIRMRIAPDREENGLVIKGGVIVEDVSTAGVKQ